MIARILPIAIGAVAGTIGIVLVGLVWSWADDTEHSRAVTLTRSEPRPIFALDLPEVTGDGPFSLASGNDPYRRHAADIAKVTAEAAEHFGVPLRLLDTCVGTAAHRVPDSDLWTLEAVPPGELERIVSPTSARDRTAAAAVIAFLDEDPHLIDSHLSTRPELGIAVRAALLAASQAEMREAFGDLGLAPDDTTLWLATAIASEVGKGPMMAVVDELLSLPAARRGTAFVLPSATYELIADRRFVMRAFLDVFPREDVEGLRERFVRAATRAATQLELVAEVALEETGVDTEFQKPTWSIRD